MIGYEAIGHHKPWLGKRFHFASSNPFSKAREQNLQLAPGKLFKLRFAENHRSQSTLLGAQLLHKWLRHAEAVLRLLRISSHVCHCR